jgi:putative flippase GtrA
MVADRTIATVAAVMVSASLPFYLYGAWVMIDRETDHVTWDLLVYHLKFIFPGLILTTIPVTTWMIPRLFGQLEGLAMLHAFLGLQAYALLGFGLTGIVRIFQVKRDADLYEIEDPDTNLNDLHENMSAWRGRLRIGVFGYVLLWMLAYVVGLYRFYLIHLSG